MSDAGKAIAVVTVIAALALVFCWSVAREKRLRRKWATEDDRIGSIRSTEGWEVHIDASNESGCADDDNTGERATCEDPHRGPIRSMIVAVMRFNQNNAKERAKRPDLYPPDRYP